MNITIMDDSICEADEMFTVSIASNETDCVIIQSGFGEGTVTIFDDDGGYLCNENVTSLKTIC